MPTPQASARRSGRDRPGARERRRRRAVVSGGALGRLIRAVETFGFHLATLDLRQNSDGPRARRRRAAQGRGRRGRLSRARRGRRASRCSAASWPARGRCASPFADYSDETRVRAGDRPRRRRGACAATGRPASPPISSPRPQSVSDLLEVNILLKEAGLYRPGDPPTRRDHGGAAVRDDRRSRGRARRS